MGRAALDEGAIRLLEEHHPDLEFDWTRILKGQQEDPQTERRQIPRPAGRQDRESRPQPPQTRPAPRPSAARVAATPPQEKEPAFVTPADEGPLTAAHAKLGSEGVSRLRGRYAEMLARIGERTQDPERQAELKTLAERLNPDAWVTDADVLAGLDSYEATFESLRSVVGRRRKRGNRPIPQSDRNQTDASDQNQPDRSGGNGNASGGSGPAE